jgi:ribosomal protein L37AE/L43A
MKKTDNSERETQIKGELVNIDKFHCPECARLMSPRTLEKHKCEGCGKVIEQITIFGRG